MPRIYGEKVVLREFRESDLEGIREWVNDEEITGLLSDSDIFINPHSLKESQNFLNSSLFMDQNNIKMVIADQKTDEYLGQIRIFNINWKNSRCSFDIVLKSKELFSRGLGFDACSEVVSHIFNRLNLSKIEVSIPTKNEPAINLFKKLKFKEEGLLRNHLFMEGAYTSISLYGLLRSEY